MVDFLSTRGQACLESFLSLAFKILRTVDCSKLPYAFEQSVSCERSECIKVSTRFSLPSARGKR